MEAATSQAFWRIAVCAALVVGVAACEPPGPAATPSQSAAPASAPAQAKPSPPAPVYRDPLAGLYNIPASSVPPDRRVDYYAPGQPARAGAPGRAVLTMAIVTGANFNRAATYAESRGLDPQPLIDGAVAILKDRYPWVELMDDVATAAQRNVSLTLVLDIRTEIGPDDGARVALDVIVFDEARKPVSRIRADGSGEGAAAAAYETASEGALAALKEKAETLLN